MTENELKDAVCELVGLAEDYDSYENFEKLDKAGVEIINCLEEIQAYRAIGTVEECRNAVERMKPRKYTTSKMMSEYVECPNCGSSHVDKYCSDCGQCIDWSK